MAATIVLVAMIVMTVVAFYLVWLNRASETIITAVLPITIASIGVYLAVLVFGGVAPVTSYFPSTFIYEIESKTPISIPLRPLNPTLFTVSQLKKKRPGLFDNTEDELGQRLYHHFLQKAIIDWMGLRFRHTWQTEISRFELPAVITESFAPMEGEVEPSEIYDSERLSKILKGNYFADTYSGPKVQIAVPLGTAITVTPPGQGERPTYAQIRLKNNFCTLVIRTHESGWTRGSGQYRGMAGFSEEEDFGYGTAMYGVKIQATFSRFRGGHPKMNKYQYWVDTIIRGLERDFDEEHLWKKTKEEFLFRKITTR